MGPMNRTKIERVARALCELDGHEPTGIGWAVALKEAERFVRAHEVLNPRPAPSTDHLRRGRDMTRGAA